MAVYVGGDECQVIYVAKNGQQLRVSSIWVGDQQVFPPANRQEIHAFNRDTQGYGRTDNGTHFGYTVPVPWWATSMDVVLIGAGEKGRDGTKSIMGGSDGAGGKSGAWVVKTVALTQATDAVVRVGKGTSASPHATEMILPGVGGQADVRVHDGEGTRTPNNGSTGGSVTPQSRNDFANYHIGGYGGSRNNPGNHPGGGGGGGQGSGLIGNPTTGQPGGDGYVWLRFRSAPALNPGDTGFILRVGVISGWAFDALRNWAVSIGKTHQTITEITVPMEVTGPSLNSLFRDCYALTSVPELDTSQVTDTGFMFSGCSSLESVTLPGMGNAFLYKRILDMGATKLNAAAANALMQSLGTPTPGGTLQLPTTATGANTSIATAKNWAVTIGDEMVALRVGVTSGHAYDPLRNWAVGIGKTHQTITEITVPMEVVGPSLYALFYECYALTTIPELNTSQVTNMYGMFYDCHALTTIPELDTSQATNMRSMFYNCHALTSVPDMDTSQATNMRSMFYGCSSLTTVPALNTSQVTDMYAMFYNCSSLTSVPELDTSKATNMYAMFYDCSSLTTVRELDTSQITDMHFMFYNCSSLTSVPELDTSKATNMNSMFYDCSSLTTVPAMNTSQATDMQYMFYNCSSLTSVPELDTSQITSTRSMFYDCHALTSVPDLDTSQVTEMRFMFYGCSSLTTVPALNTSQVTDMYAMFTNCSSLTSVPELDTSKVTNMGYMFTNCSSLTTIPALDTSKVTDMGSMFNGCSSLESVTLPGMGRAFTSKGTLDMKATKLNAAAANALMQSLGTVPAAANGTTLQLPSTAAGADTSIATAKNWTVTIG